MKPSIQGVMLMVFGMACMMIAGTSVAATNGSANTHSHEHGAPASSLQLNAGKKWETDAPLRQAMAGIRQAMAAALHDIHENRLSKKAYGVLAKRVEKAVGEMVTSCKLEPMADAQLHLIISELLEGAKQMAGKTRPVNRQGGAILVIGALEKYATYFDDPGFTPIMH